jgi:putative restriction endonuclease
MPHGQIPGTGVGQTFPSRQSLFDAGVHRALQAGIAGYGDGAPAESIVLSGGYPDDVDEGDKIIYTGQGGQDQPRGRQVRDQTATLGNLGLMRACDQGEPVRVIRKVGSEYRYEGLYRIERYWRERGRDGPFIYRFKLVQAQVEVVTALPPAPIVGAARVTPTGNPAPSTVRQTVARVVRDTQVSRHVKAAHRNRCQVCGITLTVPSGTYAEAAHVRPLGAPHFGPDTIDNVICLCPNDHVLFDKGAIWIDDGLLVQPAGTPLLDPHLNPIELEHVRYHRNSRAQP